MMILSESKYTCKQLKFDVLKINILNVMDMSDIWLFFSFIHSKFKIMMFDCLWQFATHFL